MSRPHKFKEQVSNVQYPTSKLILVTISNLVYDACTHIPEKIVNVDANIFDKVYDYYGNGPGKDYYGNDCK